MRVENTDLAKQLEAKTLGARLWRLRPGQASTRHRHRAEHELYVVLEGTGRMRVDDELLTLEPLSAVLVEPEHTRQVFNDTETDALWLVVGRRRRVAQHPGDERGGACQSAIRTGRRPCRRSSAAANSSRRA